MPPAFIVIGRSPVPITENGCPATLTCVICTTVDPVLVSEMAELVVWPSGTEPNVTTFGDAEREPVCPANPIIEAPPQPASAKSAKLNTAMRQSFVFPEHD